MKLYQVPLVGDGKSSGEYSIASADAKIQVPNRAKRAPFRLEPLVLYVLLPNERHGFLTRKFSYQFQKQSITY